MSTYPNNATLYTLKQARRQAKAALSPADKLRIARSLQLLASHIRRCMRHPTKPRDPSWSVAAGRSKG